MVSKEMTDKSSNSYNFYIIFLAVAGFILALYTTLPYGAGVSSDAIRNLAAAENVLNGKGFVDLIGNPFLWWPPLYPLILVALSKLTSLDIFIVGWVLNLVLCGVNIWLSGILFQHIFAQRMIFAYLNTLAIFLSLPLLRVSANIASDPLFITFLLAWFILWGEWDGKANSTLFWLAFFAGMAAFQRLLGVTLIGVGALLIFVKLRNDLLKGISFATMFGVGSFLPLGGWLIGRNYRLYHTFFGGRSYNEMLPGENFVNSAGKVLDWFYPYYTVSNLFKYWFLVIVPLGIVLLLINKKADWQNWFKHLGGSYVAPGLIFSAIYFLVLMYTIDSLDQRYDVSDRYQVVILFSLLTVISISLDQLILSHLALSSKQVNIGLIGLFAVWSIYPVYGLNKYITNSHKNGEASYNLYNTRALNESPTIRDAKKIIANEPGAQLYSNVPGAVWFFTRHSLNEMIPFRGLTKDEFREQMAGWPYDKPGYIIWFEPDVYEIYYPPKDLLLIADLKVVSKTSDGTIFSVAPRKSP